MAKMVERTCACGCGQKFMARVADVKRGWGKYASKSCKARDQERKTGQYRAMREREDDNYGHPFMSGVFGHGQE